MTGDGSRYLGTDPVTNGAWILSRVALGNRGQNGFQCAVTLSTRTAFPEAVQTPLPVTLATTGALGGA